MKGDKFVLGCDLLFPWKALMPLAAAAATVFRLLNNRGRWVAECGRRRRRGGTAWKRSLLQCLIKVNLHALGDRTRKRARKRAPGRVNATTNGPRCQTYLTQKASQTLYRVPQ